MRWETHRREIKRRLAQETIITFPRHFCCLLSTTSRPTIPIVIISVPSFFFFFSAYNFILSSLSLSLSLAPRYIQRSVGSELFYAIVKCYILILYTYIFLSLSLSLSPPRPNKWPAVFSHNLLATKSSTIFFLYFQKRKEDEEEE
jgi:hypothetical protein